MFFPLNFQCCKEKFNNTGKFQHSLKFPVLSKSPDFIFFHNTDYTFEEMTSFFSLSFITSDANLDQCPLDFTIY